MTLGITGSTGSLGGRVARALAARGVGQRLIVRDPARAPDLPGTEVAVAGYAERDAARRALSGVDTLFFVSASEAADRRDQQQAFVEAAAEAGVRHVVYTSSVGANAASTFTLGRDHHATEVAITEAGLDHTFLRDNFYADLLPLFADEHGVIRGPAGAGRVAAVGRADVADSAVAVLTDPAAHRDQVYDLTGPEAVSLDELAGRASAALGRSIRFVDETVAEAYASRASFGAEPWQLDAWVSTYQAIAAGELARVSDDVPRLTGHPARRLEDVWAGR